MKIIKKGSGQGREQIILHFVSLCIFWILSVKPIQKQKVLY